MSKVAGSRVPPSKQLNTVLLYLLEVMLYMLWSFAEYARNLISQQQQQQNNSVGSIISFYLLSFIIMQVSS